MNLNNDEIINIVNKINDLLREKKCNMNDTCTIFASLICAVIYDNLDSNKVEELKNSFCIEFVELIHKHIKIRKNIKL